MMNKTRFIVIFTLTCSLFASFIYISLEDRIKASELVIIGKIDSLKANAIDVTQKNGFPNTFLNIAYIKIHKILSSKLSGIDTLNTIPLVMYSIKGKAVSGLIIHKIGKYGIWILDKQDKDKLFSSKSFLNNHQNIDSLLKVLDIDKKDIFSATHPNDFHEIDSLNKVLDTINKLELDLKELENKGTHDLPK
ncbi:MAG TPA: hypothetical protein PLP37_08690 [Clostridiales bacterium]|nr:hypothetical protein [Clostridiales bacterium]